MPPRFLTNSLRHRPSLPTRPLAVARRRATAAFPRRYASHVSTRRKANQGIGGIFEPFLKLDSDSQKTAEPAEPEGTKPTAPNLKDLAIKDILPSDDQLKSFINHKQISIPIETQKHTAERALRIVAEDDSSPEAAAEVLRLAGGKSAEVTALANIVLQGSKHGVPVALRLYKIAMDVGDDNAAYSYANMLYRGHRGTPRDSDAGQEILTRLAHKGHPYAQMALAAVKMREKGDGAKAVQLYELAAKGGLDSGWTEIGRMYRAGLGVKQDHVKAIEYFRKGAQAGNAQSNFMLGVYYSSGMGLPDNQPNHELAFKYFQSAAIRGLPEAQHNLGMRYLQGHGVAQSFTHAAQYFSMAAVQGFQLAEANLARMYEEGRGVKKDLERAKELYRAVARKNGQIGEDAVKRLKDLEEEDGGKCLIM